MCGNQHGGSQTVRSQVSIIFRSEGLSRAHDLNLNPGDIETAIDAIAAELELIPDLTKLAPYEKPIVEAPIVPAAVVPKWPRPTVARPQPQPTALHPMSTSAFGGMADRMAEAEARNEDQRKEWRKAGTLPHGNPLQVNQSLT